MLVEPARDWQSAEPVWPLSTEPFQRATFTLSWQGIDREVLRKAKWQELMMGDRTVIK